jgi:ATP-dependent DNA helicase RecG
MNQQLNLFDNLSLYEGVDVEYKGALGGLPRDLWETYSAFANTSGGTIWLGITQRDERLSVHGLDNPEKLLSDFWNTLNNRGKVNRSLLSEADVSVLALDNTKRSVIRIRVPRASRRERPIFLGSDPFKGTYRRNYEGDYQCNEDEVRRMFADQSEDPADSRILAGFSMDDLDPDSIRQFRNRFVSRDPNHVWLREDDLGLVTKLGGYRKDRRTGEEGLTLAGLLMFGKSDAITAPEGVANFQLDYRERLSDDPNIRWTDRVTVDGTWEANLLQFYQRVMLKLSVGPGIKAPFQRDEEGYRKTGTPVHEALQEALVNALIHADYSGQGGVVIDRYPDRFEFSNPGTLLLSREQLLRGSISECRNRSLQRMFQMLGVGDKAGSGMDKIRSGWASQHWQSPSLLETYRPDRVKLVLPMVSMLPETTIQHLQGLLGEAFTDLSPEEVQTLALAEMAGEVSNPRLQDMLPMHPVDITRLLQGLVRRGFLAPVGWGRWTRYVLTTPAQATSHQEAAGPSSDHSGSADRAAIPPAKDPSSPVKATIPPAKDPSSPVSDSASEDASLLAIARPIRESERATPQEVVNAILALCDGRFLTIRELATLLGRKPDALRESYVSDLVRQNKLELRYPDKPSHRKQGYRKRDA